MDDVPNYQAGGFGSQWQPSQGRASGFGAENDPTYDYALQQYEDAGGKSSSLLGSLSTDLFALLDPMEGEYGALPPEYGTPGQGPGYGEDQDPHQGYNIPIPNRTAPGYARQQQAPSIMRNGQVNLRSVSELPDRFRALWNFPFFNAIQSECFDVAFKSDSNLVVSAPTGAGKTVILELAIARELMKASRDNVKMIYMAPTRVSDGSRNFYSKQ